MLSRGGGLLHARRYTIARLAPMNPRRSREHPYVTSASDYKAMRAASIEASVEEKANFWLEYAKKSVAWFKEPTVALDDSRKPFYRWFPDASVNLCYNALDRHVKAGRGDLTAIAYDSAVGGPSRRISYEEMLQITSAFAGALQDMGISKGDRVVIYMPMVPEAIVAMLACNRIGAVHSVVFGGFAATELAARLHHAQPKAVVTATCGIEKGHVLPYLPIIGKAIGMLEGPAKTTLQHLIVHERKEFAGHDGYVDSAGDLDGVSTHPFAAVTAHGRLAECAELNANDPLYILYTSGTTGHPKGILRDNTHVVGLQWSMDNFMAMAPGQTYFAASDIGWVVGHSYIAFGPLMQGCTSVLYEGKPIGTPDAGAYWRIVEQYKVNALFTAPTAVRAIRQADPLLSESAKYDTSSLQKVFVAGERCDPATMNFLHDHLRAGDVDVVDHWWQTETGWPITGFLDKELGMRPGSCGKPLAGWDLHVFCAETGQPAAKDEEGSLALRLPLPPGTLTTLYENDEGYLKSYYAEFGEGEARSGFYISGDAGHIDEDGYVHVMARNDDIINVAGHRISTGNLEEVVLGHPEVVECAVIGVPDELRGYVPVALIVLAAGKAQDRDPRKIEEEVVHLIREKVGAVACLKQCRVLQALPKTRSGKILRNALRSMAAGTKVVLPGTIEDRSVIRFSEEALRELGLPAPIAAAK